MTTGPGTTTINDLYIVLVDYGYSEWFDTRDMRPHGLFNGKEHAARFAAKIEASGETQHDGTPVKAWPLKMESNSMAKRWSS